MQTVIVKRLPMTEVVRSQTEPVVGTSRPCDCIDEIWGVPDPNCRHCDGKGVIDVIPSEQWSAVTSGEKCVWITSAEIVHDSADTISDDEEEVMMSDIHAFFQPTEDIHIDDMVIPSGTQETYRVTYVQQVRDLNNTILLDCYLEEV